jgi:hypothetical protein
MRPDPSIPSSRLARFIHERPWIWIVIGYCAFVVAILSVVAIAVKNREPSVPLSVHGR